LKLYHYTCHHSIRAIIEGKGRLVPNTAPGFQNAVMARAKQWGLSDEVAYAYPVVWVTDIDVRTRHDAKLIGLGQIAGNLTDCFRIEYRFIVPNVGLVPWRQWADLHDEAPEGFRGLLETVDGADPDHWWVSDKVIPGARLDTKYHAIRQEGLEPVPT
jgi:hypothetical protein